MVLNYNVLINGIIWVWFVLFGTRFLQSIVYSVFIVNINSGFLTVDCCREETVIWTFFVISSNINEVTIQLAAWYLVNCRLYSDYS
jgi:hypothetical protein